MLAMREAIQAYGCAERGTKVLEQPKMKILVLEAVNEDSEDHDDDKRDSLKRMTRDA